MILKGAPIANEVYERLPKTGARLGIVVGDVDPVIESFVKIKEKAAAKLGVTLVRSELLPGASTDEAIAAVLDLAPEVDGIIVQLPLPSHIDTERVLSAIPGDKDVDGISLSPLVRPPVAEAVREILEHQKVEVRGLSAAVVGEGRLVGRPSADLLRDLGAHVDVLTRGDSLEELKNADIVVLGAGEPGLVKKTHLKEGVIVIDAGTSETGGKVLGDADPDCAEVARIFTPVPGGVGPIAVAMIFKNLFALKKNER